jgi:hypothetical protein
MAFSDKTSTSGEHSSNFEPKCFDISDDTKRALVRSYYEQEHSLTDIAIFVTIPILLIGFSVIAFISASMGLVVMIALLTLFMIFFAFV